jgi:hypothetical protein
MAPPSPHACLSGARATAPAACKTLGAAHCKSLAAATDTGCSTVRAKQSQHTKGSCRRSCLWYVLPMSLCFLRGLRGGGGVGGADTVVAIVGIHFSGHVHECKGILGEGVCEGGVTCAREGGGVDVVAVCNRFVEVGGHLECCATTIAHASRCAVLQVVLHLDQPRLVNLGKSALQAPPASCSCARRRRPLPLTLQLPQQQSATRYGRPWAM